MGQPETGGKNVSTINSEFFEALALLEKERGIPMTYLIEKISNAIAVAIKREDVYKRQRYRLQGGFDGEEISDRKSG